MKRVCVYCGSSPGRGDVYLEAARSLGRLLAERGAGLVYGGASVGLMGAVADAVLEAGGEVLGVIPRDLEAREVAHHGLTELQVVASMHERKTIMSEAADAFIALPGGLGTVEELFEMLTWLQLGYHDKPCGALDVDGYFEPIVAFLDRAVDRGFLRAQHRGLLLVEPTSRRLLDGLDARLKVSADTRRSDQVEKWL